MPKGYSKKPINRVSKTYKGRIHDGVERTPYRMLCNMKNLDFFKMNIGLEEACKDHERYPFQIVGYKGESEQLVILKAYYEDGRELELQFNTLKCKLIVVLIKPQ